MTRGFTLIEVVLYLTLFSIIVGGGVTCAYYLLASAATGSAYTELVAESDFLLGKISFVIAEEPGVSLSAHTLTTPSHVLRLVDTNLMLDDAVLNAADVNVNVISFTLLPTPARIETVVTLSTRAVNGKVLERTATSTTYME